MGVCVIVVVAEHCLRCGSGTDAAAGDAARAGANGLSAGRGRYSPRFDLRTDFVMAYGVDAAHGRASRAVAEAGYVLQVMTGVAWGDYSGISRRQSSTAGRIGTKPKCEPPASASCTIRARRTSCPAWPSASTWKQGIDALIDAGVVAIHLEEPEFWARGGFSEAFQREWQIYYNEPWQRPDSSVRRPVSRQQAQVLPVPPHARSALLGDERIRVDQAQPHRCGSTCPRTA